MPTEPSHDRRRPSTPGSSAIEPRSKRLTEQVERLAHHAVRGEIWDKAVTYLSQAGARRSPGRASGDARFESAGGLTHSRTPRREQSSIASARNSIFRWEKSSRSPRHERGQALGDRVGRLISAYMSEHFRLTGLGGHGVGTERAIAEGLEDLPLTVRRTLPGHRTSPQALSAGREFLEKTVQPLRRSRSRAFRPGGIPRRDGARLLDLGPGRAGRVRAINRGHEAVRFAETLNHPYSLAFACRGLGLSHQGTSVRRLPARRGPPCAAVEPALTTPTLTGMLGYVYASGACPGLGSCNTRWRPGIHRLHVFLTPDRASGRARLLADHSSARPRRESPRALSTSAVRKRGRCASWARSRRIAIRATSRRPRAATVRP